MTQYVCLVGNTGKGISSINLRSGQWAASWAEESCPSHLVHRYPCPPSACVSLWAEHAAGATSKKMILGSVPGVISGLTQKRSVSAFLLIFSTLWFPLVSFKAVVVVSGTPLWQKCLLPQENPMLFFPAQYLLASLCSEMSLWKLI